MTMVNFVKGAFNIVKFGRETTLIRLGTLSSFSIEPRQRTPWMRYIP